MRVEVILSLLDRRTVFSRVVEASVRWCAAGVSLMQAQTNVSLKQLTVRCSILQQSDTTKTRRHKRQVA